MDEGEIKDKNYVVKVITAGAVAEWPMDQHGLFVMVLNTKYAILHKIAMTN